MPLPCSFCFAKSISSLCSFFLVLKYYWQVYYARVTSITAERKRKENSNLLHYKTTKRTCILRWKALFERTEYSTIFRSNQRCIQLSWTSKVKAEFTQPTR